MNSTVRASNGKGPLAFVWVPQNLDVGGLRRAEGVRIAGGVAWLCHSILVQVAQDARCREDRARVPLSTAALRAVIPQRSLGTVRDAAERLGIVARDRSYRPEGRSQSYWLQEPYASAPPVKRGLAEVADSILRRNIRRWEESRQRETWRRIHNNETPVAREVCGFLWRHLQRLRLDSGIELAGGFDQAHEIVADAIRGRRFWFVVDAYGRIHTPLTNLPRFMRAHLAVEGRRLVGVDIGESQPLFIGLALATAAGDTTGREEEEQEAVRGGEGHHRDSSLMLGTTMLGKSTGRLFDRARLPRDLAEYLDLCEAGGLYQTVADRLGVTRNEAKPEVMKVLFGKPWHRAAASGALDERFPGVMDAMRAIKRGNHRRLAHFAQRIESRFMYGRVVPRIMAERPGLFAGTIHDGVFTTVGEEQYVRRVMLEEFGRLGVRPKVKVERC